jgi:hypothetical protein
MYNLIEDAAYHFETQCCVCHKKEHSETFIRKSIPGEESPERTREEKLFAKCLEQRGWEPEANLCKECADDIVLERTGRAFKDALTAKAGER